MQPEFQPSWGKAKTNEIGDADANRARTDAVRSSPVRSASRSAPQRPDFEPAWGRGNGSDAGGDAARPEADARRQGPSTSRPSRPDFEPAWGRGKSSAEADNETSSRPTQQTRQSQSQSRSSRPDFEPAWGKSRTGNVQEEEARRPLEASKSGVSRGPAGSSAQADFSPSWAKAKSADFASGRPGDASPAGSPSGRDGGGPGRGKPDLEPTWSRSKTAGQMGRADDEMLIGKTATMNTSLGRSATTHIASGTWSKQGQDNAMPAWAVRALAEDGAPASDDRPDRRLIRSQSEVTIRRQASAAAPPASTKPAYVPAMTSASLAESEDLGSPRKHQSLGASDFTTSTMAPQSPQPLRKAAGSPQQGSDRWRQWGRMVDSKTAHYSPAGMDIAADYWETDSQQQDYDAALADSRLLHRRRPSDALHPDADCDKPPAATAFTDRSLRLREGRHMRTVMMKAQFEEQDTEWAGHGDCNCAVCKPHGRRAAGAVSHEVHSNKEPPCGTDFHPSCSTTSPHPMATDRLFKVLSHEYTSPRSTAEDPVFAKSLGPKVRSPTALNLKSGAMPHRCLSESDLHAPAAGNFNQDNRAEIMTNRCKMRMAWQPLETERHRSGVAFVLDPMEDDPPAPTSVLASRKARGAFREGYSADSEKLSVSRNPEVFRFADAAVVRGRSPDPALAPGEAAGLTCGEWTRQRDRLHGIPASSPSKTSRTNARNRSPNMTLLMNHDVIQQSFEYEKAFRLRADPKFAEICQHTAEHHDAHRQLAATLKNTFGHHATRAAGEVFWAPGGDRLE